MRGPDVRYGCVTLLASPEGGRHPSGNSLLISGTEGTVVVAPSLQVDRRGGVSAATELMAVTRAHEDHVAGLHLFPEVPVVVHPAGVAAVRDPEALLSGFGMTDADAAVFRRQLRDTFPVSGHGRRSVTVVHLPGHTAGHCGLLVEPDGTSHHVGVRDDRQTFLEALDRFAAVIDRRDEPLLRLLRRPRTLEDVGRTPTAATSRCDGHSPGRAVPRGHGRMLGGPGGRHPPGPTATRPGESRLSPTGAASATRGRRRCGARRARARRRWRTPARTWPVGSARRPRSPAR